MRTLLLSFILSCGLFQGNKAKAQSILAGIHGIGDVYTDLVPDTEQIALAVHLSPYPPFSDSIDLDLNGVPDVEIVSAGDGGLGGGSGGSGIIPLQPNVQIVAYYDTFQICCPTDVVRLVADSIGLNDTISDQLTYYNDFTAFWSYGYGQTSTPYIPNWCNIGEHFVGFRITYTQDTLYGWIRVNTTSTGPSQFHLYIMDYACNINTNAVIPIQAFTGASIYPNPFMNELQLNGSLLFPVQLTVFGSEGKKVIKRTFYDKSIIQTDFLSSGIYYYELRDNADAIRRGKLIKENTSK